jgi:hypothetical protein
VGQQRAQQEDPALGIGEIDEGREGKRNHAGHAHDQGHVDQRVVAELDQYVPGGMHHRRQQDEQGPSKGKSHEGIRSAAEGVRKLSRFWHTRARRGKSVASMAA